MDVNSKITIAYLRNFDSAIQSHDIVSDLTSIETILGFDSPKVKSQDSVEDGVWGGIFSSVGSHLVYLFDIESRYQYIEVVGTVQDAYGCESSQ